MISTIDLYRRPRGVRATLMRLLEDSAAHRERRRPSRATTPGLTSAQRRTPPVRACVTARTDRPYGATPRRMRGEGRRIRRRASNRVPIFLVALGRLSEKVTRKRRRRTPDTTHRARRQGPTTSRPIRRCSRRATKFASRWALFRQRRATCAKKARRRGRNRRSATTMGMKGVGGTPISATSQDLRIVSRRRRILVCGAPVETPIARRRRARGALGGRRAIRT